MSVLLAARKLQADLAGLTGPAQRFVTVGPTVAEFSQLFHGESGSLQGLVNGGHGVPLLPVSDAYATHPGLVVNPTRPMAAPPQPANQPLPVPSLQGVGMPAGHGGLEGLYA